MRRRPHSIRFLLVALVAALAVPLLALTGYNIWERAQQRRAEAGAHASDVARLVARNLDQLLTDSLAVLKPLSRLPVFADPDNLNCPQARELLPEAGGIYASAIVVNARGLARCSSAPLQDETLSVADRRYFQQLQAGASSAVSEPVVGRILGRWVVVVARAIRGPEGEFLGALLLPLDLQRLSASFTDDVGLPVDGVVAVLSGEGRVVARSRGPTAWIGREVGDSPLAQVLTGEEVVTEPVAGLDQELRLYSEASVARTGWTVAAGFPYQVLFGPVEAQLRRTLIVTVLAGLAIALLALWTSRRITGPIGSLTRAVEHFGRAGEHAPLPVQGPRELRELATRFNTMALERQQAAEQLALSEQRFRVTFACAGVGLAHLDREGRLLRFNPLMATILGQTPAALEHLPLGELLGGADRSQVEANLQAIFSGRTRRLSSEHFLRCPRGESCWIWLTLSAAEDGERYAVAVVEDITERRRAEARERQDAQVFRWSSESVLITDTRGIIQRVNAGFTRITGYSEEEALGQTPRLIKSGHHDRSFYQQMWHSIHTLGVWRGEIWNRRRDGSVFPAWLTISGVRDEAGRTTNYVGLFSDLSHQKETQSRLRQLQNYDPLTGLPNRALLHSQLDYVAASAADHGDNCALMLIDIDNFRALNDALGHHQGDQAVRILAQRLREAVPLPGTVARTSGDEFGVLVEHVRPERLSELAERVLAAIAEPIRLQEREIILSASIGIAVAPRDGRSANDLLRAADTAMHRSKASGPGGYRFHTAAMARLAHQRFSLEADLRRALERDELRLEYQPKALVDGAAIVGAEALLRWDHPRRGAIPPQQFVRIAEEAGLIDALGDWALFTACRAAADWGRAGRACPVAVNLSARQLARRGLVQSVERQLRENGLDPQLLELEVTETALVADLHHSAAILGQLRAMGVRLAIDDFGTGYSSLRYLQQFAPDHLKIDKSFLERLENSAADRAIVDAVVSLGHGLAMRVIAEGVEHALQLRFLKGVGCDEMQGYLFSRPVAPEVFREMLRVA